MPKRVYFIPRKDGAFFSFQRVLVTKVQAKKTDWGIPDAAVDVLVNHRAIYEPLYRKVRNKNSRTAVDGAAHRRERKAYEKDIRKFVNAHVRYNDRMTDADRLSIGVPARDTKPSPKPRINDIPFAGLEPMGGGWIKVTCRRETDQDRPSMHDYADVIECRFALLPVRPQPVDGKRFKFPSPEECPEVRTSTRAQFIIKCGVKNAGQSFYGFFRWVNLSNPANNGVWSNALNVVIA